MEPTEKSLKVVSLVAGPSKIAGAVSRLAELEDGSARVETWSPSARAWLEGGAFVSEFFEAPPARPEFMRSLGIPEEDIPSE